MRLHSIIAHKTSDSRVVLIIRLTKGHLAEGVIVNELLDLLPCGLHQKATADHVLVVLLYHRSRGYLGDEPGVIRVRSCNLVLLRVKSIR